MPINPMVNRTIIQYFHWYLKADGNFWKETAAQAAQLENLGINAAWLPPACKGSDGIASNGYDTYDLYDLGEFDQKGACRTKFGTKDEYLGAIKALKQHAVKVYADIILNHKGGADATEKIQVCKVDPGNRNEFISRPFYIDAHTVFNFAGRQKKYSSFQWDYRCFSGVDYAADTKENGIFKIINKYGKDWNNVVGTENGNFDYLMFADIEFRNPAVTKELKRWGKWYLKTTGIDGIRLDAVKHMSPAFINEWLDAMRGERPDLFVVGEYWSPDNPPVMKQYLKAVANRMSLFDAKLHHNFCDAANAGSEYDLRRIFDNTLVKAKPSLAVTIVDNHDTQPLQGLQSWVGSWFKPMAYALILLRKSGYPCLFYPDLYGAVYTGKNKDGVDESITIDKTGGIEQLLMARKNYAYGKQRDYFDDPNCVGWTREGVAKIKQSGCAVLLSNKNAGLKNMNIGKQHAGKTFIDLLGNSKKKIAISKLGWGIFSCPPNSISVWVDKYHADLK